MSHAPGPGVRLGVLVPSSNSNAESSIARMLAGRSDVAAHFSRFRLPASLSDVIDLDVLGTAPDLLVDVEPDAVAFHGTSGSWTGFDGDRALAAQLAERTGAPATTATLAVRSALAALGITEASLVFPGPPEIAAAIVAQYAQDGVDFTAVSTPAAVYTNAEIARLGHAAIEAMIAPVIPAAQESGALVCIGTNLRSAYLVERLENAHGITVIDSASATLWDLLQSAGASPAVTGWGRLLAHD